MKMAQFEPSVSKRGMFAGSCLMEGEGVGGGALVEDNGTDGDDEDKVMAIEAGAIEAVGR